MLKQDSTKASGGCISGKRQRCGLIKQGQARFLRKKLFEQIKGPFLDVRPAKMCFRGLEATQWFGEHTVM